MQASDIPLWSPKRFAQDATGPYVRAVPQTSTDPAAASMSLGFPPQTFIDEDAGGTPPDGRDFNGILNFLSAWAQYLGAGGSLPWSNAIANGGGYPLGAVVVSTTNSGRLWESTVNNNTSNPDAAGAGWRPLARRTATLAEMQAGTSDSVLATPLAVSLAGYDRVIGQNLIDNRGYRAYASGFKEAWGFTNTLGPGTSELVSFGSFMNGNQFTSFHRVTLGAGIVASGGASVTVGIAATDVNGFTVRNAGSSSASYQWSTRGV